MRVRDPGNCSDYFENGCGGLHSAPVSRDHFATDLPHPPPLFIILLRRKNPAIDRFLPIEGRNHRRHRKTTENTEISLCFSAPLLPLPFPHPWRPRRSHTPIDTDFHRLKEETREGTEKPQKTQKFLCASLRLCFLCAFITLGALIHRELVTSAFKNLCYVCSALYG